MDSHLCYVLKFGLLVTESFIFSVAMTTSVSNPNFEMVCGVLKTVIQGFDLGRVLFSGK
jgi:hypothetical protein